MQALATLIKIKNKEIEELQIKIASLTKQIEYFEDEIRNIEIAVKTQQEFVNNNPNMHVFFPAYYSRSREISTEHLISIAEKKSEINLLQEKLMEQYIELKTYEVALEKVKKSINYKLQTEDTKVFDEIGLRKFTNKPEEEGSD